MKLFSKKQNPSSDATLVEELRLALASAEEKVLREREEKTILKMALDEANQCSQHFENKLNLQNQSNASLTEALTESRGEVRALQAENKALHDEKRMMEDKVQDLIEQREDEQHHFKMVYEAVKASYGQVKLQNSKLLERIQAQEEQMKKQHLSNVETELESQRLREQIVHLEAELTTKANLENEMIQELKQEKKRNSDLQKEASEHKDTLRPTYKEMALPAKQVESEDLKRFTKKIQHDKSDMIPAEEGDAEVMSRQTKGDKESCALQLPLEKDKAISDVKETVQQYQCMDLISAEEAQEEVEALRLKVETLQKVSHYIADEHEEMQQILQEKDKTISNLKDALQNYQRNDLINAEEAYEEIKALKTKAEILQKVAQNMADENEELQRILLDKEQAINHLKENIEKHHEREKALMETHTKALEEKQRDTEIWKEEVKNHWLLEVNEKSAIISRLERELTENKTFQERFTQELEEKIAQELEANIRTIEKLEEKLKLVERRRQTEIRSMSRVMRGLEESLRQAQQRASALAWRNIFRWRS